MTAFCDVCDKRPGNRMVIVCGIETWVCDVCSGWEPDEIDTRESEAREFKDEQLRWNDSFEGGWEREAADTAGMPLHERFRP